ncbi:MAG: UDP-glucose 4-epimerase GalE [Phycisphaerales bacterium]
MSTILVTGAAGYIGSHAVKRLLAAGKRVVGVDNLSRGHRPAIDRLASLAPDRFAFEQADVGDTKRMARILAEHKVTDLMHFAAYALVGESVEQPLLYYQNNTAATARLLEACDLAAAGTTLGSRSPGVQRVVFSSTCATYGEPDESRIPIEESCPQSPINPYGRSKLASEMLLKDWADARNRAGTPVAMALLRYFNVCGSDSAGLLGEHHDPETHLIPVVLQVALGQRDKVKVFGTDYPTPDGTCLRDYIHVEDLVDAHAVVLDALNPASAAKGGAGAARIYNLGTGKAASVREILEAARRVTGHPIPAVEVDRRPGDPPVLLANPSRIASDLGWKAATTSVDRMVETAWRWFRENPKGYAAK